MSKDKNGLPDDATADSPRSGESRRNRTVPVCAAPIVNESAGGVKPPACVRGGMKRISLMPLRLREVV